MGTTYMRHGDGQVFTTDHPEYHPGAERLTAAEGKRQRVAYCVKKLRGMLRPGDTVQTVLRHVSRSGMLRRIDLYVARKNELVYLSGYASDVLGMRVHKDGGLIVGGCGMDMGFHIVYELSRALWPDGHTCAGEKCRSNDHTNGDRNRKPHKHSDGGYALSQKWL